MTKQPSEIRLGDADSALIPNDPQFGAQSHLSGSLGSLNTTAAWFDYTGLGVRVAVLDDGVDYMHPDLVYPSQFHSQLVISAKKK
ncbi:MAG: hypothetical protein FJY37_20260 [Betaproteobacteria bacterium]|nr:hypothetical protein [Betaproteobacteria bacterium]MBM3993244.1 hypothetical protein [Planctomycetota bacterium]